MNDRISTEEDLTEPEEDAGRLWWGGSVDDYEFEEACQ